MRSKNCPKYTTIAAGLAEAIRGGALPAGTRLPTHRALAREHGVAVATASRVYAELAAAGLVTGETGRGTYVLDQSGHTGLEPRRLGRAERVADLTFNQPRAPFMADLLRRALRDLAGQGALDDLLAQQPPGGRLADRAAMATYLLERGVDVPPANLLLTNGAQHALDVALGAVAAPGALVGVDPLTYPGVKLIAEARHLRLAATRRLDRVSVLYVMPTLHNPLGHVLGLDDRIRLVALARRHDLLLVEDGTHAHLVPDAPPPLQALAPERTLYAGSLSKNLATGLRAGYLVVPDAHLPAVTRLLRASAWSTPGLTAALATRWIRDGTVAKLDDHHRADARRRQEIAFAELGDLGYQAHPGSSFGWLPLPEEIRSDAAAADLAANGILVSASDAFAVPPFTANGLRLALADPPIDELAGVLRVIRAVPRRATRPEAGNRGVR
uniref:aminotransferase-like domain-containing protein n=1 Tax=Herbidospora sakaeratensis TaxID=564415 RepID=UPI000782F56E|nr:PLP-dependent aminotransferase family protein [Herbidospora sakaeratensis]